MLAAALRVEEARLPAITARWRRAGYAATGRLGPGPAWCWLTRDGMTATGLAYPAVRPSLGRLAHIRAVLAARLWLQAIPAWASGHAWWHSERRLRADQRSAELHHQREQAQAQSDALQAIVPKAADPTLLDELPLARISCPAWIPS